VWFREVVGGGSVPGAGSRHDALTFGASGLAAAVEELHTLADPGYLELERST
jgi:hypothetical protein